MRKGGRHFCKGPHSDVRKCMRSFVAAAVYALLLSSASHLSYGADTVLGQTTWTAGNGHAYAIVEFPSETWTSAAADITSTLPGFHLATITSQAEQDFVWGFLQQTTDGGSEWWLGGFQDLENETDPAAGWAWVTDEPWVYTNWAPSEPNNGGAVEDHLALSGAYWNDEGTAISAVRGYIAEKSNVPALDIEKLTNSSQADGANWPDVPRINSGTTIKWTYVVTNKDPNAYSEAEILVTDSQPGITPTLDIASDDGDMILSPGETWIYEAVGQALDLSAPPPGVTVVPGCGDGRNTYENTAQVEIVGRGVIDQDLSHYCNSGLLQIDIRKQEEGPDTRTFPSGSDVSFVIHVTNTGTIDLDNVVVNDPQVPACSSTIVSLPAGSSTTYTCNALNVTQSIQNEACVSGRSTENVPDTVQDCDSSSVHIEPLPTIKGREYLPLVDGSRWTYRINGVSTETVRVLPGTKLINGIATKPIEISHDSDIDTSYYTSDENGVRYHGDYDPLPPPEITSILNPPAVYIRGIASVPEVVDSAGTASLIIPSISPTPFVFSYTMRSEVEGLETVTVPAGTFEAIKITSTTHVFGYSQGLSLEETFVETNWYARDLGIVQWIDKDSDGTEISVLTSTNVNPDRDGDGLVNSEELSIGTDPMNPDTDHDALTDGQEINIYHSNPLDADTDDDGLADGQEVTVYGTSPLETDTDRDGLRDGYEVAEGLDPTDSSDCPDWICGIAHRGWRIKLLDQSQ